jgi:transcriptional regulator of acetoin/glycerol metabolism
VVPAVVTTPNDLISAPSRTETTMTGVVPSLVGAARQPGLVQIFPRTLQAAATCWPLRKSSITLGRGAEADIQLDDPSVSRAHVQFELLDDGVRVTDLDSRHGTFVEASPARAVAKKASFGSVIRVGRTLLLVVENVGPYALPPQRISGNLLGTGRDVIGGPQLSEAWQQARQVSPLSHPVLILGESGSGKEAIARLIHASRPEPGPFVALNIAAIPEGLFESELFGHVKGAFTGAVAANQGAFREASGGVLFLDEVADLRRDLQPKLLRAIDQMRVRPLGAKDDVAVNVRVVAATSRDLQDLCTRGEFRLDLYYRLAGIVIQLPALRDRRDEIITIALHTLAQEHHDMQLSAPAAEALVVARWEGNVRQLSHALTHAAVRARAAGSNKILPEHLPELSVASELPDGPVTVDAIRSALASAEGNASKAAKALGISRATLYNILKREGIDPTTLRAK